MTIARWSPFSMVATWPSQLDTRVPALGVQKTETGYRLQAALPGFKPEEVEVTLDAGVLTISAKRSEEKGSSMFASRYKRRLTVPRDVTADEIQANLENGVLTVDVKYDPAAKAVRIPVTGQALPEPATTAAA